MADNSSPNDISHLTDGAPIEEQIPLPCEDIPMNQPEEFTCDIPELPKAKQLDFMLCSSWDDPYFVGLNALEVFTAEGTRAEIEEVSVLYG